MNTHDIDIELPPLPSLVGFAAVNGQWTLEQTIHKYAMDYARAAIEADRKRQYRPVYEEGWKDALEWVSKRRGEPVAYLRKDHLQQIRRKGPMVGEINTHPRPDLVAVYADPQLAEPVKVPSDAQPLLDMIDTLCTGLEWNIENHPAIMNEADREALAEARALLARYGNSHVGQPAQPAAPEPPSSD